MAHSDKELKGVKNSMEINDVTGEIITAAIKVHTELEPGLFESYMKRYWRMS